MIYKGQNDPNCMLSNLLVNWIRMGQGLLNRESIYILKTCSAGKKKFPVAVNKKASKKNITDELTDL